jgi:hypothetical protein
MAAVVEGRGARLSLPKVAVAQVRPVQGVMVLLLPGVLELLVVPLVGPTVAL